MKITRQMPLHYTTTTIMTYAVLLKLFDLKDKNFTDKKIQSNTPLIKGNKIFYFDNSISLTTS